MNNNKYELIKIVVTTYVDEELKHEDYENFDLWETEEVITDDVTDLYFYNINQVKTYLNRITGLLNYDEDDELEVGDEIDTDVDNIYINNKTVAGYKTYLIKYYEETEEKVLLNINKFLNLYNINDFNSYKIEDITDFEEWDELLENLEDLSEDEKINALMEMGKIDSIDSLNEWLEKLDDVSLYTDIWSEEQLGEMIFEEGWMKPFYNMSEDEKGELQYYIDDAAVGRNYLINSYNSMITSYGFCETFE